MTPEKFVIKLQAVVIEENNLYYQEAFSKKDDNQVTTPYWKKALGLFESLSEDQRVAFFEVIRQTSVDTVSFIFGAIDGSTYIDGIDGDFQLTLDGEIISGDLQDIFLANEEDLLEQRKHASLGQLPQPEGCGLKEPKTLVCPIRRCLTNSKG